MASARQILAPYRIVDEELQRVVFGIGDPMTDAEAKKYGVPPPKEPPVDDATKQARRRSQDRTKRVDNDRADS